MSAAVVVLVASLAAAEAEGPASDPSERAVRLGHQALQHFSAGRFEEALGAFGQADELAHSPVFVLYRARAHRALGQLLLARDLYQECAREEVTASTPATWKTATADAAHELDQLRSRIPSLRVKLQGGVVLPLTLKAGERTLTVVEPETIWELDPGVHQIEAVDSVGTKLVVPWHVRAGQRNVPLVFAFPRLVRGPSRAQKLTPEPAGVVPIDEPSRATRSGAHAAFLLGGAGLIFGTVSGAIAYSKARKVKKNCIGSSCRPEDQELAVRARDWANTATASYVAGTVGVATGVGLILWSRPSRNGAEDAAVVGVAPEMLADSHAPGISLRGAF